MMMQIVSAGQEFEKLTAIISYAGGKGADNAVFYPMRKGHSRAFNQFSSKALRP
jgi:hypothetical protein